MSRRSGQADHRYVVCPNSEGEIRDRKRREQIIESAREDLKNKGPQAFIMPRGLTRFVEVLYSREPKTMYGAILCSVPELTFLTRPNVLV